MKVEERGGGRGKMRRHDERRKKDERNERVGKLIDGRSE
jgi:hypothetical protein